MTINVPPSKPADEKEAYRRIAEALNQNNAETQPFYVRKVGEPFTAEKTYGIYIVDTVAFGSTVSATMPLAAAHTHRQFVIKKIDGGHSVKILPSGSDTIEQATHYDMTTPGESVRLVSDGVSDWVHIGGK